MLSLTELRRAVRVLETKLPGATLAQLVQRDDFTLILTFHHSGKTVPDTCHILLSCRPGFTRVSAIRESAASSAAMRPFAQYLGAHLGRASFIGARIIDDDRQAAILVQTSGGNFEILLSILGSRSNIYLLGASGKILYSMRRLEDTRRDLLVGEVWTSPGTPIGTVGLDRWAEEPDETFLESIEQHYSQLENKSDLERQRREILRTLAKEEEFLKRKTVNLHNDLEISRGAADYKRWGELLKTVMQQVRPEASTVTAYDYETGAEVTIPLNPTLSASGNLELYFSRYQKALRTQRELTRQLDRVRAEQAELENLRLEFQSLVCDDSPNVEAVRSFASLPKVRKLLGRHYRRPKAPTGFSKKTSTAYKLPGRLQPKRYKSVDGLEIWVGRNDEGNDYLTTRLARGNDLFFHLEGSAGSHVVLRTEGRKDPPSESLLEACELAVHFSKQAQTNRADVHVASIKDVKKPSGAKPGLVYVRRGKTIHLRRDPKRLERVLASRLDE